MDRPRSDAESIFLAALERTDRGRRAAFVAVACSSDDALRRRVDALLRAHDAAGSFLGGPPAGADFQAGDLTDAGDGRPAGADTLTILSRCYGEMPRVLLRDPADGLETPVPGPAAAGEATPRPPSARYQFFGEIARGGMGTVLKGHDTELNRDLAFKVLLDRHRENAELVRRFVEEAQIGGQLQHPGIVPIYELGILPDRRPFFAMKLVKGHTLAEILGERDEPDEDRPRLLSIFEAVCQTVAYAHARGVIHRDLKPSNVMVGSFGEVQVMDWGLAKVLPRGGAVDDRPGPGPDPEAPLSVILTARSDSDAQASQAGSVLGTPGYMAPEQARGELDQLDERADVFGLGAILCEILTGAPAFVGRTTAETLRKAGRGELADAFGRLEGRGADSELIAMAKDCLAPERDDRPRRAGAAAVRITAYLAGVQERLRAAEVARAEDRARAREALRTAEAAEARARAERRSRRLAVGMAAAVLALFGLGGGGYAWFQGYRASRALIANQGINDALTRAAEIRGRAATSPAPDVSAWGEALAEVKRAEDLLRQGEADPSLGDRLAIARTETERGRADAVGKLQRRAADRTLLDRLEMARGDRAEHGDPKRTDAEYAAAFRDAGLDLDAITPEQAAAWVAGCTAPIIELAAFLDDWAMVRRAAGADEKAVGRLVATARLVDPDTWRNALRAGIGARGAAAAEALRKLAGDEESLDVQPAESLLLLAKRLILDGDRDGAMRLLRRAWRLRPGDFWVNLELAQSRGIQGPRGLEYPREHTDEAVRHLTAALAVRRSHIAQYHLGLALYEQGKLDEAIAEFHEAIRINPDVAQAHSGLGNALSRQGKPDEAIAELRTAIRLMPDHADYHNNLGTVLNAQGKHDEAIAEYREAIRINPERAGVHYNLGNALSRQGKPDQAIAEYREAIRLSPDLAVAYNGLGSALDEQGKHDESIAAFRAAIRIQPGFAGAHANLGLLLYGVGKREEGLVAMREARDRAGPEPERLLPGIGRHIALAERVIRLERRLPAILKGQEQPADPVEGLALADLCYSQGLFASSARLYALAFTADHKLADDRPAQYRYNAACAAALAGAGKGNDRPPPGDPEQARWRHQALDWLRAELAVWSRLAGSGPPRVRTSVHQTLRHWKVDRDLAVVRDPEALARLPDAERADWQSLWAEVDRLLNAATAPAPK